MELIDLTLNEIRKYASRIDKTNTILICRPDNNNEEFINSNKEALDDLRFKLIDCLDGIIEYMDGRCMLDECDIKLGGEILDLIYERKTEKDYEED